MKDSGIPWLGQIPAHWECQRNGRLFVQRNETGFSRLPILEVSLRTGVQVRDFDSSNRKQVMADGDLYKRAAKGDIAYNTMRMWQGAVGVAPVVQAVHGQRIVPPLADRYDVQLDIRQPAHWVAIARSRKAGNCLRVLF